MSLALVPAASAQAASVRVVGVDGGARTVRESTLRANADVAPVEYSVRDATSDAPRTVGGTSLRRVVTLAGGDPDAVAGVTVEGSIPGLEAALDAGDLAQDAVWEDGPPVFHLADGGVGFIRPTRGPADTNADEVLDPEPSLTVTLQRGSEIGVTIQATPEEVDAASDPIDFSATLSGAASGQELGYRWRFPGDPRVYEEDEVAHEFASEGRHRVRVQVVDGGRVVASASKVVTVGDPAETDDPTAPSEGSTGGDGAGSPSGDGGGGATGGGGGGGGADADAGGPSGGPAASPADARPSPTPAGPRPSPTPTPSPAATPEPLRPGFRRIEGVLLDGLPAAAVAALAPSPPPAARADPARAAALLRPPGGRDLDLPPWLPALAAVALAVLLGAVVERRPFPEWPFRAVPSGES